MGVLSREKLHPRVPGCAAVAGRLIVFEGIDGSGKSTALAAVAERLWQRGVQVATTREETATERGAWVRRSIEEGLDPLTTTFLFLADRAEHVREIGAWRAEGRHVLCDRFLHSTLAYQAVTLADRFGDEAAAMAYLRSLHRPWCPEPDHVLLFRADPATCVARTAGRGAPPSPYEKAGFLARVQDAYLRLAGEEPERFTVVDAERGADAVAEEALRVVGCGLGI